MERVPVKGHRIPVMSDHNGLCVDGLHQFANILYAHGQVVNYSESN